VTKYASQLTDKFYLRELTGSRDHVFNKFDKLTTCKYVDGDSKDMFNPSFDSYHNTCILTGKDTLSTCEAKSKSPQHLRICPCSEL
jgi:hypothetical protein